MPPLPPISPTGVLTAFGYPAQTSAGQGIGPQLTANPGSTNAPIIFEPPPGLSGGQLLVWIIATGASPDWGGCAVYASIDNATYGALGTILAGGVQGVLTATFASGSDPDTTHTLAVDISESLAQLIAGTTQDADDFLTLCYCGGELVSYSAATLTSAYNYSLGTYIRRGCYGTAIASHAAGSQFGRVLGSTFSQQYPSNFVGKTLYFKFPAFNTFGAAAQQLSAVPYYTYTLTGIGANPLSRLALRRVAQGGTYSLALTDYLLEVGAGSAAGTTINGPAGALPNGLRFELKDKTGTADQYPITFTPAGGQTVDGKSTYAINQEWGAAIFTWDTVEWSAS